MVQNPGNLYNGTMDEIIKADVFFFVTTIAIGLLALGASVAMIYVIVILAKIKKLVDKLEMEADTLIDDFGDLREGVRSKAHLAGRFLEAFSIASIIKKVTDFARSRRKTTPNEDQQTERERDEEEGDRSGDRY